MWYRVENWEIWWGKDLWNERETRFKLEYKEKQRNSFSELYGERTEETHLQKKFSIVNRKIFLSESWRFSIKVEIFPQNPSSLHPSCEVFVLI